MLKRFVEYVKQNRIIDKNEKTLLAVSGGIDSVVMLNLFTKAGFKCAIAHCNFHLRNKEYDADDQFVSQLAQRYNVDYYKIDFDTKNYAQEHGVSVEMAARTLRYEWFEKIRIESKSAYIATAHHQNDVVETFFMNLARGTGIRGLSGIKIKNERHIIRPMLFAQRKDIEEYCHLENLEYRIDSTNSQTKYVRNKFRHLILPFFEEVNPSFNQTVIRNVERFRDIEQIYLSEIHNKQQSCVSERNGAIYIDIEKLVELNPIKPYLLEFLRPYNFTYDLIEEIIPHLGDISGKQFFSSSHRLIKDRHELIITKLNTAVEIEVQIKENEIVIEKPIKLAISRLDKSEEFSFSKKNEIACFDLDKVSFPLTLRKWKIGDHFFPLGMKNKKKLSDFFNDNKFSILDKENTWLLISNDQIMWIVGKRIDNRFKITEETKRILQIELI